MERRVIRWLMKLDDVDLYDDMIGADDMEELFGDSDEDDE